MNYSFGSATIAMFNELLIGSATIAMFNNYSLAVQQ